VSPFRPSFFPQPGVFSQRFDLSGQPRCVSHAVSYYCALLNSLAALFATPLLCFQQLAHSFVKMPGGGYVSRIPVRALDSQRESTKTPPVGDASTGLPCTPTPLLPITSLQLQRFHAITHSFAQRRAPIPRLLNGFRTLSIATGVVPSPTATSRSLVYAYLCASVPLWQSIFIPVLACLCPSRRRT
jgi:hypothetical protein